MSVPDFYLDPSLQAIIDDCNLVVLCSAEPTTFDEANNEDGGSPAGFRVGSATPSLSIVNGATDGRTLRQAAIASGPVEDTDAVGTTQFVAFIDTVGERICATCAVTNDQVVTDGNTWSLAQLDVWTIRDPA